MDAPPCSQAEARRDSIVGWTLLGGLVLSIGVMGLGLVLEAVDGSQGGDHVLPLDQILPSLAQGKPPAVVDLGIVLLFATPVIGVVAALEEFIRERDIPFILITALLLMVLAAGFVIALR